MVARWFRDADDAFDGSHHECGSIGDIQTLLDTTVPLAAPKSAGENGTPIVEQRIHAPAKTRIHTADLLNQVI